MYMYKSIIQVRFTAAYAFCSKAYSKDICPSTVAMRIDGTLAGDTADQFPEGTKVIWDYEDGNYREYVRGKLTRCSAAQLPKNHYQKDLLGDFAREVNMWIINRCPMFQYGKVPFVQQFASDGEEKTFNPCLRLTIDESATLILDIKIREPLVSRTTSKGLTYVEPSGDIVDFRLYPR